MIDLRNEATIKESVSFSGIGAHSGNNIYMTIKPASENSGIIFKRTDITDRDGYIKLSPESVIEPILCTKVVNASGVSVSVIEHLLAAFRIAGITNALIEINSGEVPIMDGSSKVFLDAFKKIGISYQNAKVPAIVIKTPIVAENSSGKISILPSKNRKISVKLSYDRINETIGNDNTYEFDMEDDISEIAIARTFGWFEDCEKIRSLGMAKGSSEENTIVIMPDYSIKNSGGLRNPHELVMHKCLDLLGDIAVIDHDIIGSITAINPSHSLNNILMRKLLSELDRHDVVENEETEEFQELNLAAC